MIVRPPNVRYPDKKCKHGHDLSVVGVRVNAKTGYDAYCMECMRLKSVAKRIQALRMSRYPTGGKY